MKNKIALILFSLLFLIAQNAFASDKGNGINFYTGMFDFSDEGKRSQLFGIEHQNENLFRDTAIGEISPVTGFMITGDNAMYMYSGFEANYSIGIIKR